MHIKTDSFDGPLGLLLLLVKNEEMSIRDLDINRITRQYLEYVEKMHELNFDVAGDFLYMTAVLLFLKSKSFVSEEDVRKLIGIEGESDLHIASEEELIRRLQELKRYQELGQELWNLSKLGHEIYIKPKTNRKDILAEIIPPMDIQELTNTWIEFLRKKKKKYQVVEKDKISIKERLTFLKALLKVGEQTSFFDLLQKEDSADKEKKIRTIMTFISLLELARLKKIKISQEKRGSNIFIDVRESLADFNINLANGFEPEASVETVQITQENL